MYSLETFLLPAICLAIGLCGYFNLKRQLRIAPEKLTPNHIVEHKMGILMFLLGAISVLGFNFLPVERANFNVSGATPQLLWLSFFSSILLLIVAKLVLTRIKYKFSIILSLCVFPIVVVMNSGILLAINGALDLTKPKRHQVEVLSKQILSRKSRSGPDYVLFVRNWKYPEGPVRLFPSPDVFKTTNIGDKLLVEIGAGLLGIEWVKSIQPEFTSPAPQTE